MPKRRYINARYYLERIYVKQRQIRERQEELIKELAELGESYELLDDRAGALIAYDWQSRHHFPILEEIHGTADCAT